MPPTLKFVHFAAAGYIVMVFQTDKDARQALRALLASPHQDAEVLLFHSNEVIAELMLRADHESISDIVAYADESETHAQLLGYARQGCSFLNALASSVAQQNEMRRCVQRFHPKRIQWYHVHNIDDVMHTYHAKLKLE